MDLLSGSYGVLSSSIARWQGRGCLPAQDWPIPRDHRALPQMCLPYIQSLYPQPCLHLTVTHPAHVPPALNHLRPGTEQPAGIIPTCHCGFLWKGHEGQACSPSSCSHLLAQTGAPQGPAWPAPLSGNVHSKFLFQWHWPLHVTTVFPQEQMRHPGTLAPRKAATYKILRSLSLWFWRCMPRWLILP